MYAPLLSMNRKSRGWLGKVCMALGGGGGADGSVVSVTMSSLSTLWKSTTETKIKMLFNN